MDETKVPEGTVETFKIPLDRAKTKFAVFHLRECDEETFMAFKTYVNQKKTFDGIRLLVKQLALPGSDDVNLLRTNFVALNALGLLIVDFLEPLEGEVKKNY